MGQDVEWRIKVGDNGSSETLIPETTIGVIIGSMIRHRLAKLWKFLKKAWELGMNDPRKFIHCLKVSIALTAVSLCYYIKPLYDGVGGNAMWAVMTVVVVFEYTAGATLCKTINRIFGTSLAGFLAIGVHWVASKAGQQLEPFIVDVSLFLLASTATFSRFIPSIKARFDYGAVIFILTYCLVSVSGYRVDELLDMARQRLSTIIIGTSLCLIVSMTICPVWAGYELYVLTTSNMDKLANSLDGCVSQYFTCAQVPNVGDEETKKKLLGYKSVLSSKATEDSMANFARWEPAHGRFSFRHPWKQYLKVGASMRSCASCIDALVGCINLEAKVPNELKEKIGVVCLKVSSNSVSVIRELANTIRNMTKSPKLGILVGEMNNAAQELKDVLKSYPIDHNLLINNNNDNNNPTSHDDAKTQACPPKLVLMEIVQLVTVASLLIEIVARVEAIVNTVQQLADLAQFLPPPSIKPLHQL